MSKTYLFTFPKDKLEHFETIGLSRRRDDVITEAAALCGAKVDENRVDREERIMKVRCTSEAQQSYILLKCSDFMNHG